MSHPVGRSIQMSSLSNGIRVITEEMPSVRSVATGLWVGVGSRSEQPAENGISHFIEHMLFKGTRNRSAEDIARQVDSIGGHLDAFTGKELVGFNTKVIDENLPRAFDILCDLLLNPLFEGQDIEKEKGVILEELKMENDNPENVVHELFMANFFPKHSLGRSILGTRRTIRSFGPDSVRAYHARFYTPENLTITAAGHLCHTDLVKLAEDRFSALRAGGEVPMSDPPRAHAAIELRNKRSLQQLQLCIGVPCHESAHPLRYACYLLNIILGAGMSSRLFQNIRERQGLVYSVYSELNLYKDSGCLAIYAGTSLETLRRVVDSILIELRQLKDHLVPTEELRRAKDHLKGSMMLNLESTSSRMSNLARQYLYHGRFFTLDEMIANIEQVTAEEMQGVACEFFQTDKIAAAILGRLDGFALDRSALAC
jgi:predicted Zn-dependent peptidase